MTTLEPWIENKEQQEPHARTNAHVCMQAGRIGGLHGKSIWLLFVYLSLPASGNRGGAFREDNPPDVPGQGVPEYLMSVQMGGLWRLA